jgi:hypothetical protein
MLQVSERCLWWLWKKWRRSSGEIKKRSKKREIREGSGSLRSVRKRRRRRDRNGRRRSSWKRERKAGKKANSLRMRKSNPKINL